MSPVPLYRHERCLSFSRGLTDEAAAGVLSVCYQGKTEVYRNVENKFTVLCS